MRRRSRWSLVAAAVLVFGLATPAAAAVAPPGVRAIGNVQDGQRIDVTPADLQPVPAGGYVALGTTTSSTGATTVSWVVRLDEDGAPLWQRELGCVTGAPGGQSIGVAVVPASDGTFLVVGSATGCGTSRRCGPSSSLSCALLERLSARGRLLSARVFDIGRAGTVLTAARPTDDRGVIAVGTANPSGDATQAVAVRLDVRDDVVWERTLVGPHGRQLLLEDVAQTSDGGYVLVGRLTDPSGPGTSSGAVVRLAAAGDVRWRRVYDNHDSAGRLLGSTALTSVLDLGDRGLLVAGRWIDETTSFAYGCCTGALVLRLTATGSVRWQRAYIGDVYCFYNGFNQVCRRLGSGANAVVPTADGGYLLAGDTELRLTDSTPLVPWLAHIGGGGRLLWQQAYSETHPSTGRPTSQYFDTLVPAAGGGSFALGRTLDPAALVGDLYGVRTDAGGLVGDGCGRQTPTALRAVDPALIGASFPLRARPAGVRIGRSPATSHATGVTSRTSCFQPPNTVTIATR